MRQIQMRGLVRSLILGSGHRIPYMLRFLFSKKNYNFIEILLWKNGQDDAAYLGKE